MNIYLRAWLRFWWLLAIGAGAGLFVGVVIANKHKPPTYFAQQQLMVDSGSGPFLRTSVTTVQQQPPRSQITRVPAPGTGTSTGAQKGTRPTVTSTTQVVTVPQPAQVLTQTPATAAPVQAANLYPVLISSDVIANLRDKMFGHLDGKVYSQALYQQNPAQGRFRPSMFPIISIGAQASTPAGARKLANATSSAFRRWLLLSQKATGIPKKQRILVHPLVWPRNVSVQTHTRRGLAAIAGAAVLAGFLALALGIDNLVPRRERLAEEQREEVPEVAAASHKLSR